MKIYLVRHGQSMWQVGQSTSKDSEITDLGRMQAYYLNTHIKNMLEITSESSIIYVSPLKRAIQTIESLGKDYILYPKIKEASFHVSSTLPQFDHPQFYSKKFSEEPKYKIFKKKIKKVLEYFITLEKHNVILYTHGGVIKTILRIMHDNDCICYTINNCSITYINWYRAKWHIHYLNNVSFLPKEYVT